MRFINKWAYVCANGLTRQLGENHEKRRVFYYGFQIVIGSAVKLVILTSISLLIGAFAETFSVLVFFVSLRLLAGGYHMDTYGKCLFTSLAIFLLAGFTVRYTYMYWNVWFIALLAIITFVTALYVIIRWAPADTPNKPITKPAQIRRLKVLSIVQIFVWAALTVFLLFYRLNMYAIAGCFGMLLAAFIVSPIGYGFFDMISGRLIRGKKCKAA